MELEVQIIYISLVWLLISNCS